MPEKYSQTSNDKNEAPQTYFPVRNSSPKKTSATSVGGDGRPTTAGDRREEILSVESVFRVEKHGKTPEAAARRTDRPRSRLPAVFGSEGFSKSTISIFIVPNKSPRDFRFVFRFLANIFKNETGGPTFPLGRPEATQSKPTASLQ